MLAQKYNSLYYLAPPPPPDTGHFSVGCYEPAFFLMTSISSLIFVSIWASIGVCMECARFAQVHPNISKFSILYQFLNFYFLRSC